MNPLPRPTSPALAAAARGALAKFDISPRAQIARLQDGENTTWKVTPPGRRAPVVLRLHRANYQTPARIEGELQWLEALAHALPGLAPTPKRSREGRALYNIAVRGSAALRPASLLTWSTGRFPAWPGQLRTLAHLGALTAKLHSHTRSWRSAAKQRRPALGFDEHAGPKCHWGFDPLAVPGLRTRQRKYLAKTLRDLRQRIGAWDKPRTTRGLIHADLHLGNVLIEKGQARAIDFDDCVRTWWLMDPAVTLLAAALQDGFELRLEAYWNGYASEGGVIAGADRELLAAFQLLRFISMFAWSYTRSDNARIKAYHTRRQVLMLTACKAWHKTDGARIR